MDATDGPPDPLVVPTLRDLVKRHGDETGESNRALGERSGISHQTFTTWEKKTISMFPDPDTIRRFASATGYTEQTVLLAAARSIGLRVSDRGTPLINSLPPGSDILDPADIAAIRAIVRQLVSARRQPAHPVDLSNVEGLRESEDEPVHDTERNGTVR